MRVYMVKHANRDIYIYIYIYILTRIALLRVHTSSKGLYVYFIRLKSAGVSRERFGGKLAKPLAGIVGDAPRRLEACFSVTVKCGNCSIYATITAFAYAVHTPAYDTLLYLCIRTYTCICICTCTCVYVYITVN